MIKETWCNLFHAGGDIVRDPEGLINWQCRTCGRWSVPVSKAQERRTIEEDLAAMAD